MQKVVNVRPVHGLIFLFHWKQEPNEEEVELSCPENLWFANQVIDNSCASLALLNIILNVPDLDIGDHLSQFREFTKDFSPPVSPSPLGWGWLMVVTGTGVDEFLVFEKLA